MYTFDISIPLTLEQKNYYKENVNFDKTILEFEHKGVIDDTPYRLYNENEKYGLSFYQMKAVDQNECAQKLAVLVDKVLKVASFIIQKNFKNQHSTHLRLIYNPTEISYTEIPIIEKYDEEKSPDQFLINSTIKIQHFVTIKTIQKIDLEPLDKVILKSKDSNFCFILDCYYRALAATDYKTKYYNAFAPIELIEEQYKNKTSKNTSKILTLQEIENIKEKISPFFIDSEKQQVSAKDDSTRHEKNLKFNIYNSISTSLNTTSESRAYKLQKLLTEYFEITDVKSGILQYNIDSKKMKDFIKRRNQLFHAREMKPEQEESHQNLCLELIILIEAILNSMLKLNC
ncbi:MAG: hypothetical protein PWP56_2596 [Acetobacterium sp.]|jgi:hypothetical protein|nr:hypothetical protein [Acetobacterium sp. KB-1]AWW25498.1 hypothetical protein DOZ58_01870 [Acetobacterium sp. KB-1]MDK2943083.1 hypothetical protein [Acetobacterium sp.]